MFNPPPADLHSREPLIYAASTAQIWYRSHKTGRDAVFFGRNRTFIWDAPRGDYGVLYLGADERCAFMESIGRGVLRTRLVPASQLKTLEFSRVRFSTELRLVDLVASGGFDTCGCGGESG
jgi:hypothetical protein